MKNETSDYELRQGQRLLVLLAVALLISCHSISHNVALFGHSSAPRQKVVWLSPGNQDKLEGVWLLDEETTTRDLCSFLHCQPLFSRHNDITVEPFSTLVLPAGGQDGLQKASIDPRLASLVFKPLSINRSDAETLTVLDGIGAALAERIVRYRELIGRYNSSDQLLEVRGIGRKSLKRFVDQVTLD